MASTVLIDSLKKVRRRVRALSIAHGLALLVGAAVGIFAGVVFADYLLNLSPLPRLVLMAAGLVWLGYLAARRIVRPATARLPLSDVAGQLENAFPNFDDRLRSGVDFLTNESIPGSGAMKQRVLDEAAQMTRHADLAAAVNSRPVWKAAAWAAAAVLAILAIGLALGPEYVRPALSRVFDPFGAAQWPKRVQIEVIGRLPSRVPASHAIDVRMRLTKGDRSGREARLLYEYGDGPVQTELMTRGSDGIYSASVDAGGDPNSRRIAAVKIWMSSGDDQTPPVTVDVVPQLMLTSVQLVVTPPPYAKEPPVTLALDSAPATVTYGSELELKATFNKTLDASRPVRITASGNEPAKLPPIAWAAPQGQSVTGRWSARDSTLFSLRAFDLDGFTNSDVSDFQIVVHPDEMPDVQITAPAENLQCTPQAILPLKGLAEDDFGIRALNLATVRLGDSPRSLPPLPLVIAGKPAATVSWAATEAVGDRRHWEIGYAWDLSKIPGGIRPGDTIEYRLTVQDNFDFEGQQHPPVSSARYRIAIMSQEQFTSLMSDLMAQVRQEIVDLKNSQTGLKDRMADLRQQTQTEPQFSKADRHQAGEIAGEQTTAAAEARQSASRLDELLARMQENQSTASDLKSTAAAVRDALNQLAEHSMKDAAASVDDAANQTANPKSDAAQRKAAIDRRNATMDQAQANAQSAAEKLSELAQKLGNVGGLPEAIQQLQDLLAAQQQLSQKGDELGLKNLGKTPDQMDPHDRKSQEGLADQQAAMAQKMDENIQRLSSSAQKLQKSDPTSAQAMQQAAQTGQQQSISAQMRNAASQQRQNQQSEVQNAHAQVELGLQMMINDLEEAQKRKLEELARQLADMQEQIAELVRQQASLNYQNLALRGAAVLKSIDAKLVGHLLEDAHWAPGQTPPTPDFGSQTRLQEQTERNARSIAKVVEALPDSTKISSGIVRAADRMGRAIGFMRDDQGTDAQRLANAYDPPQTEALAALEGARQLIDEQVRKNSDQLNQQRKDSIRQQYEKILAQQKKLDEETASIDKSPRGPDGAISHRQAVRLAQLPPEQAALADRADKLTDVLNVVGSIVYVWANHDIVQTMRQVRADLAKPDTGAQTQAEQTRIEEQVQAMIDSLKTKPKTSPFAQHGAGGGGQSGAPPLPPEAELRLLKRLQEAVNKSTLTIAAQAGKHDPALVALGGRQEDLRGLLNQLLEKASGGKMKLAAEPKPGEKLPEEASDESIENDELEQQLLTGNGQPTADATKQDVDLVGIRMARSRQRLANDHDPGKVTQAIQKRILQNLDALIDAARQQQAETQSQPQNAQAQQANPNNAQVRAQPNNSQSQSATAGHTPAAVSTSGHDVSTANTPTADITQTLKEWGGLSPRKRAAVIEAASEKPVEKFKDLIDEYYRALGAKAVQPQ